LYGKTLSLVTSRHNWSQKRVYYQNEAGILSSMPVEWTNLAHIDPFVIFSAGRAPFRVVDLLELSNLLTTILSTRKE